MKRTGILFLFIALSIASFAQYWSVGVRAGYGMYSMSELKNFQDWRLQQSALPLRATDNYPITPFYRVECAINELSFADKIGLFYTFNSTGARSTLSDYSGRYDQDAVINGSQLGLAFQHKFYTRANWGVGFYVDASWLLSTLKTKDYLKINTTQEEEYKFNSIGFAAEPGFYLKYSIRLFDIQLNLGHLFDTSGKLFLDGSKSQWLAINNAGIYPKWSGLRLGLQLSYCWGKK